MKNKNIPLNVVYKSRQAGILCPSCRVVLQKPGTEVIVLETCKSCGQKLNYDSYFNYKELLKNRKKK